MLNENTRQAIATLINESTYIKECARIIDVPATTTRTAHRVVIVGKCDREHARTTIESLQEFADYLREWGY